MNSAATDPVLYEMPHSPFCIPVAQILTACSIAFKRVNVPGWDRSEIIRITGGEYYQVPLLVHGERIVFESGGDTQDVAEYLDVVFANGRLFPTDLAGPQAAMIHFLENEVEMRAFKLADIHYVPGIEDMVARTNVIRHKERKFGRGCVDAWRAGAASIRAELDALLEPIQTTLRARPFLFGNAPVYSDFLLLGMIGVFTYEGWNQLRESQRELAAFVERIKAWRY